VTKVVQQYGDDAVQIPIRPRGAVDGLYAPRRILLDRILAESAATAGVDVRHRTGVRDVLMGPGGRALGVLIPGKNGAETVLADLVVGADGTDSLVASRVGAELERVATPRSATVYTYLDGLPDDAYHNYFRPGGAAGLIPSSGGQANVWVGIPADQFDGGGQRLRQLFDQVLHTVATDLAEQVHAGHRPRRFAAFPGRPGFARRPAGPGWALVGDAASFTDPIGAHGMTDAFVAAELLCTAMDQGTSDDDALSRYTELRREITYPLMPLIEQIASYHWDLPALQSLHLDLNTVMQSEGTAVAALAQPSSCR
jgi:flavin-dependent dehydrogenase